MFYFLEFFDRTRMTNTVGDFLQCKWHRCFPDKHAENPTQYGPKNGWNQQH